MLLLLRLLSSFIVVFSISCNGIDSTQSKESNLENRQNSENDDSNQDTNTNDDESTNADVNIAKFTVGLSYYWQLQGTINENVSVDVYDIDLEDHEKDGVITNLKNKGIKVICYFSAGTYEDWRSDKNMFPASVLGRELPDWPGERWLDIRAQQVRVVMESRIKRAKAAGCDAVEPDNVDGYQNNNGLGLTAEDQIDYLKWFAKATHENGLSVGLKNSLDIIEQGQLYNHFDWALNEECYQYNECSVLDAFVKLNKAVFIAEYVNLSNNYCSDAKNKNYSLVFYNYDLDGKKYSPCP